MNLLEAWETVEPANLVEKLPAEQILARGRVDIAEHGVKPLDSQTQVLWEKIRSGVYIMQNTVVEAAKEKKRE